MNKKGNVFGMSIQALIGIILGIIVVIATINLATGLYNVLTSKPNQGTSESFKTLNITINLAKDGYSYPVQYFIEKGFVIDEGKFRALIHLHDYHGEEKQINFWSKITRIPRKQFFKSYRKPNTGKRIKKDYPGCLAISYYDAKVAKQLWAYYKEIQNVFS